MTPRKKKLALTAIVLAAAALVVWLVFPRRQAPATAPVVQATEPLPQTEPKDPAVAANASTVAQPQVEPRENSPEEGRPALAATAPVPQTVPDSAPATNTEPPAVAAVPVPAPRPVSEAVATAQMYAAHAPLRAPEVANPDSKTNKQILGTMVAKSFAQPASPPPAAATTAAKP